MHVHFLVGLELAGEVEADRCFRAAPPPPGQTRWRLLWRCRSARGRRKDKARRRQRRRRRPRPLSVEPGPGKSCVHRENSSWYRIPSLDCPGTNPSNRSKSRNPLKSAEAELRPPAGNPCKRSHLRLAASCGSAELEPSNPIWMLGGKPGSATQAHWPAIACRLLPARRRTEEMWGREQGPGRQKGVRFEPGEVCDRSRAASAAKIGSSAWECKTGAGGEIACANCRGASAGLQLGGAHGHANVAIGAVPAELGFNREGGGEPHNTAPRKLTVQCLCQRLPHIYRVYHPHLLRWNKRTIGYRPNETRRSWEPYCSGVAA